MSFFKQASVKWIIAGLLSVLGAEAMAAPSCPAGNRMYFIGGNTPAGAYASQNLSNWTAGSLSNSYTFADGTQATISFADIVDANNAIILNGAIVAMPFYASFNNLGNGTLNVFNNTTGAKINHSVSLSVNRSTTTSGYVINDLDSIFGTGSVTLYSERFDVSGSNGQLTFNPAFHTINATNNIVTAINGQNCQAQGNIANSGCPIEATWGSANANTAFQGFHSNVIATPSAGYHAASYGDFYFCLAPPKLTVKKVLNGSRLISTDQFKVTTTGGAINNSFTTTGTGSTLTAGVGLDNSGTLTADTGVTYTITETAASGSLANYITSYNCTNTNPSGSTMPTGSGTSFNIANLSYGDAVTCTITNTPNPYTFSGTVFNDYNSITPTSTNNYDGLMNNSEVGISGATVKLTDCKSPATTLGTATTAADGTYSFVFPASNTSISSLSNVCLVETNAAVYPNDTTKNNITIPLSGAKPYPNNNFGDVTTPLLTLTKSQTLVNCADNSDLALNNTFTTADLGKPANGTGTEVPSGSCIAYKIVATNNANVGLTNVVISDKLTDTPVRQSVLYATPTPKVCVNSNPCTTTMDASSVAVGSNGTIKTAPFNIPAKGTGTLYFKVQYNKK